MEYNEAQFKPLKKLFDKYAGQMPDQWYCEFRNYFIFGLEPGSFHKACFENDLYMAAIKSDSFNDWTWVTSFMRFLYYHGPWECWGSKQKVADWMRKPLEERFKICHELGLVLTPEEVTWDVLTDDNVT